MFRLFVSLLAATIIVAASAPTVSAQSNQPPAPQRSSQSKKAAPGVININTVPAADLQRLPGIGANTAARIIEYRQKNGPFKKIEDLMNVRGVGEKKFLKLKANITVGAAKADHAGQP